jgi:uncharacterized oxidoreductase
MPVITEARLRDVCQQIVLAMGAPEDIADEVTDVLVKADAKGVDSHGCRLLRENYAQAMKHGRLFPAARAEIIRRDGATIAIEANWGFGHPAARMATRHVIELAQAYGIGAATVVHTVHIARLGDYAEIMAENNMLGIVVCNAGRAQAPTGSAQRLFGTNPIALAVPRGNGRVLLADFATSAKSVNKLMIYRQRGQSLPDGMLLDKTGAPTNDPGAYFDGGILLPAGGYKGYALALFIDIIGGILVGTGCAATLKEHPGNGALFIAVDIARWRDPEEAAAEVEELLGIVKAASPAPGVQEVLLPGELEDRMEIERRRKGIPLDDVIWHEMKTLGAELGLPASTFAL